MRRTAALGAVLRLNALTILSEVAASANEADAPPPNLLEVPLLWPALLLVLAALFGGLRALLQSPVRAQLLAGLEDAHRARVDRLLERRPWAGSAAGLARVFAIVAAVALVFQETRGLEATTKAWIWIGSALISSLLLEGVPSLVARRRARRLVLLLLPITGLLAILFRPLTWTIERTLGVFGAEDRPAAGEQLTAELMDVAAEHDREEELGEAEKRMIGRVIDLPDSDAASAMTPRTELTAIESSLSVAGALEIALEAGHSRMPVYGRDLDDIRGLFYVKDVLPLVRAQKELAEMPVVEQMREAYFVPETMAVLVLLDEMRQRRTHIAVVVDEYGGTAGVVSIEDLLEEIVGEIQDEHDDKEELGKIERVDDHVVIVEGRVSIDDLNEFFDCSLPEDEDYDTIAGLLFDRLGHIPESGESVELDDLLLEVLKADDRRIRSVRVSRRASAPESEVA